MHILESGFERGFEPSKSERDGNLGNLCLDQMHKII